MPWKSSQVVHISLIKAAAPTTCRTHLGLPHLLPPAVPQLPAPAPHTTKQITKRGLKIPASCLQGVFIVCHQMRGSDTQKLED